MGCSLSSETSKKKKRIQKIQKYKHKNPTVGWNSDEGLTRKRREREIGPIKPS